MKIVPTPLPVLQPARPERADAAENRRRVLAAACRLFDAQGAMNVSMDAVAAAAGVGKGTLFRRFGDRAGLARAVISEHEAKLQDALIRGAPPLGPGAPARERLLAFGPAYLEFLEHHSDTLLAAEYGAAPVIRQVSPPYVFYRTHLTLLLREAGCGERAEYLADVLLAPLSSATFKYHRELRGLSVGQLAEAYGDLVARLLDSGR
jgi:AcrR family transcriptional regulator